MTAPSRKVRKGGRQFEKDRKAFFLKCKAEHAVCWLCGMPIDYDAPQNSSDDSYNLDHFYPVPNAPISSMPRPASGQAIRNATTCAATKTQPHQSAHSADNGS